MKCRITKQGSNCAVLVSGTHHVAKSVRRESKFSPIFSPTSSATAFTPNPTLPPCMSAINSVSPALKPKHHACSAQKKNVRIRAYSEVFCVQLLSPCQSWFVPIISIETDLVHARQCRTCAPLRTRKKETFNFFLGLLRFRNRCKQVFMFICVKFVEATDTNMDTTLVLLGLVVICSCLCFRHQPCPCQRQTEVDFSRRTSSPSTHDEVFRGVRTMVDDVNLCRFLLLVL